MFLCVCVGFYSKAFKYRFISYILRTYQYQFSQIKRALKKELSLLLTKTKNMKKTTPLLKVSGNPT